MMNRLLKYALMTFVCLTHALVCAAQVLIVDKQGPYTNIRRNPNGTIVGRIPVDGRKKYVVVSPYNSGDWIGAYAVEDARGHRYWEASTHGEAYIHRSLIRFVPNHSTTLFRSNVDGMLEGEIGTVRRGEVCKVLRCEWGTFMWTLLKIQTPGGKVGWVWPYDDEGA